MDNSKISNAAQKYLLFIHDNFTGQQDLAVKNAFEDLKKNIENPKKNIIHIIKNKNVIYFF